MANFIALLAVVGFGYFVYTRVRKSRNKSNGEARPGGRRDNDNDVRLK